MNSKSFLFLALSIATLFSCKNETEHETATSDEHVVVADTTAYTVDDTTKFKFDFAIANIPSPASNVQEFSRWGASYDNSILNDSKNISKYTTEFQRGINLGIYNIDMAYAMVNDKGEDMLRYMKNVMTISDALGLRGAVSNMVGKRAESNLNNKDSLFKILDEIFVKSDSYLRTNERVYTAGIVFAGSWIESLYLTCKISERGDEKGKTLGRKNLWEQRFHLGNLINLLKDYSDKKEVADLIADLKPIHDEITSVKQPQDMSDEKFKSISSKIIALRNKHTS